MAEAKPKEKAPRVPGEVKCMYCDGTGKANNETCIVCGGKGKVYVSDSTRKCQFCKGRGYMMPAHPCTVCGGTGFSRPIKK